MLGDVRVVVDGFLRRPSEAAEAATVQVLNGTDIGGLATRVGLELEKAGFTIITAGNAPATDNPGKTVVYDLGATRAPAGAWPTSPAPTYSRGRCPMGRQRC